MSVSFVSLTTSDGGIFEKTAQFYTNLGFRLTKNYSKIASGAGGSDPLLHLGVSHDSLKELWFESFPLQPVDKAGNVVPWQELDFYAGDQTTHLCEPTVVKIRLSNIDTVHMPQHISFFSTQLEEVAKLLSIESSNGVVSAEDPMGNKVLFTSTDSHGEQYDSPAAYLEHQTRKARADRPAPESPLTPTSTEKKKKIAVMTSGGDAPGMNPAVRAVVRSGIYFGCDVFAVYEGYSGLVKGGDLLKKLEWNDVRSLLSAGGTNIGTARCMEFKERAGRLEAARNMVTNGIDALIVCGGDGSLTGADLFRSEWPSLVQELVDTKVFSAQEVEPYRHLTIVGLVGSIDNDMSSTDATIGAFSALERILELVDYIDETAKSHSRAFVVEVMGRHCGWLGLMSGLSTGADFIFIPERPPKAGQWQAELKEVCRRHRAKGKRLTTVIVAEGAIDDQLNPISADDVRKVLVELGLDTRITTLGHVQRGGSAVAYDRMLATLQGVEAVKAVLESTPDTPLPMIGILENKIVRQLLVDAVKLTKSVATSIEAKDFDKAMALRDSSFAEAYHQYLATTIHDDGLQVLPEKERLNIGIVHVGASSSGLNATTRAAALYCLSKGHRLFAIQNGFSGLISHGLIKELDWLDVEGWHNKGGSEIGTNRSLPSENFGNVAFYLQKYQLNGLIIVGGFESFTALHELDTNKEKYPVFCIPKVVIPATVSNNVPGTEYSLGSDTCLNQLVKYCDAVKQSASSSRRRVFVVEVQGGHSGFVASYAGLVTGAISTYTPESAINLKSIQEDIDLLFEVFEHDRGEDKNGKMIIRNEQASAVYTTELLADIIKESAKGRFETRTAIPGHVQQGYTPSSMDRVNSIRFAVKSIQFIEDWNCNMVKTLGISSSNAIQDINCIEDIENKGEATSVVIGIQGAQIQFTPIATLYQEEADVVLRKGKTIHWNNMAEVSDMLSGRSLLRRENQK